MSDDIPVIFAKPDISPRPLVIFLSATHPTQLEQYVVAGWNVWHLTPFGTCDLPADLNVAPCDPAGLSGPPELLIGDLASAPDDWKQMVTMLTPNSVKLNAAFNDIGEANTAAAAFLTDQGYTLCASYWKNDNSFGFRILDRIDALSAFQPTPWSNLNLIGYKDLAQAQSMVRFGRFYAGQESRIGELQIEKTIRADYIKQLEEAMMQLQKRKDSLVGS